MKLATGIMRLLYILHTLLLFLIWPSLLFGEERIRACQALIGSEIYHMHKVRESGTYQKGFLGGTKVTLQRLQPHKLYVAVEYLNACGSLQGKDHRERFIYSEIRDSIFEGRLGYCFEIPQARGALFLPFAGWGHFKEVNKLLPPSPLPVTYTDQFGYLAMGFLSQFFLLPHVEIGFNFKTMFMQSATSTITDDPDPEFGDITMQIRDVPYFRVELPITMHLFTSSPLSCFRITPFYEYRHFGGKEGWPFDFQDTRFNLLGFMTTIIFSF